MTKATLRFNLDDPTDAHDFYQASKASAVFAVLSEIVQRFRRHEKYDAKPFTREDFWEIIKEYDISSDYF